MRRRDRELDPRVAEDLAVLDAALAGEHADPLVTLISEEARAWAPPMTSAFAAALDEAVGRGFAKPAGSPGATRPLRARWLPAAGFAVAALIALVVVLANRGGGTATTGVSRPSVGAATRAAGAPAPRAATAPEADLAAPAVPPRPAERAPHRPLPT